MLQAWKAAGIELYVYSSGSIVAQKVLFAHTFAGDLTPLFSDHFDTTTGPKREAASYAEIAADTGFHPAEMLFLSDIEEELDAARAAGFTDRAAAAAGRHAARCDDARIRLTSTSRRFRPTSPRRNRAASARTAVDRERDGILQPQHFGVEDEVVERAVVDVRVEVVLLIAHARFVGRLDAASRVVASDVVAAGELLDPPFLARPEAESRARGCSSGASRAC